jgi:hypothetical protein
MGGGGEGGGSLDEQTHMRVGQVKPVDGAKRQEKLGRVRFRRLVSVLQSLCCSLHWQLLLLGPHPPTPLFATVRILLMRSPRCTSRAAMKRCCMRPPPPRVRPCLCVVHPACCRMSPVPPDALHLSRHPESCSWILHAPSNVVTGRC